MRNWNDGIGFKQGDQHYWGVWHGGASIKEYETNVGRFMTEYGI